jgi:aryl-alcohol dehydrogenase-like predicted oxidoreductase
MSREGSGHATAEGTRGRAEQGDMGDGFYREHGELALSTVGVGTYLGDTDPEDREAYQESLRRAIQAGVTVVDTAANYRDQASERDVGAALDELDVRDEVFLVTKGGFLHGDADADAGVRNVVRSVYMEEGLLEVDQVAGGSHALAPAFLDHELDASLENLGVDTVDLYLVHNPETQLEAGVDRATVLDRLREAFELLEEARAEGRIRGYGVATWDALRVPPDHPAHLSLEVLLELAGEAHAAAGRGDEHGFEGLQLPVNLAMPEALDRPTQPWNGERVPALEAARESELVTLGSASLLQGRLLDEVPPAVKDRLDVKRDLDAALHFARSAPGLTSALVGMGTPEHVDENLDAVRERRPDPEAVRSLLEATGGSPIDELV